jgi:hypothetical protein
MANDKLKIGDKVMWRGAWNTEPPKEATIESMSLCPKGSKFGRDIKSADWNTVKGNGRGQILVNLDNGHWAYGYQLKPIK